MCSIMPIVLTLLAIIHCLQAQSISDNRNATGRRLLDAFDCGTQTFYTFNRRQTVAKIVGGTKALLGEYPWLAMIFYSKTEKHECGGSLINERFVLTAAHCLTGTILTVAGQPTFVRLGEHDVRYNPDCDALGVCAWDVIDHSIKSSHVYPKYNSRFQMNDIGLIRLVHDVEFSDFVHPICVAGKDGIAVNDRTIFTVAGWGKTETDSSSAIQLKAQIPIYGKCQDVYTSKTFGKDQLCAGGEEGVDTCRGDSGGPLMLQVGQIWFAYGIVSHGPSKCGSKGLPGVYTNVSFFSVWIDRKLAAESG